MEDADAGGWLDRVIARFGPWLLRAHGRSLRFNVQGEDHVRSCIDSGRPIIFASWHQRIFGGLWYLGRYGPAIMISQSRDGNRIRQIAEPLGWTVERGSSSRGGARALISLIHRVRKGGVGCHVVDGPRGPARVVKPGLIVLAQRSGAAIVPVLPSMHRKIELGSWDRSQIPFPLSRVTLRFGEPIEVPKDLPEDAAEALRKHVEEVLEQEFAELDHGIPHPAAARPERSS